MKVTRQQAIGATLFGVGLALTGLAFQRQVARVTAFTAGALLPIGAWTLYCNRGAKRFLDTEANRNWLAINGTPKQFNELTVEELKCVNATQHIAPAKLNELVKDGGENGSLERDKWALAELFGRTSSSSVLLAESTKSFIETHKQDVPVEWLGQLINGYLRTAANLNDDNVKKLLRHPLELSDRDTCFTEVLKDLKPNKRWACLNVLLTCCKDDVYCDTGLTSRGQWVIKELFTRDEADDDLRVKMLLVLLNNPDQTSLAPGVIKKYENCHAESIKEIRKYVEKFVENLSRFKDVSYWPLTLLPEETVALIRQFCDRQRRAFLPDGFEAGVTEIDQTSFNISANFQVFTEEDLIKMAGAQFETKKASDSQMCWAAEQLSLREGVSLDNLLAGMEALIGVEGKITEGLAPFVGSCINNHLRLASHLKFSDAKLKKLILLPFELNKSEGYSEALLKNLQVELIEAVNNLLETKKEEK